MRVIPVLLTVALAAGGCTAQAARDPAPAPAATAPTAAASETTGMSQADEGNWKFVEVGGIAVPDDVTATMRLHEGHASGKAGCNAYNASYETGAGGHMKFGHAMSTKMACMTPTGAMRVERGVFAALRHTARIKHQGDSLILLDASGKPLARLHRQPPSS